jgi:hypothetical protein
LADPRQFPTHQYDKWKPLVGSWCATDHALQSHREEAKETFEAGNLKKAGS